MKAFQSTCSHCRGRLKKLAANKYVALHSSYYGLDPGGWGGVQSDRHTADDLTNYFDRLIAATRASEFGRQNIGFGPLASANAGPGNAAGVCATRWCVICGIDTQSESERQVVVRMEFEAVGDVPGAVREVPAFV